MTPNYPKNKTEIITTVLKTIGDDPDCPWKDIPVHTLLFRWWITGRTGAGLRLTAEGANAFDYANITYYDFPIQLKSPGQRSISTWTAFYMLVNSKLRCPFYIRVSIEDKKQLPYIRIYDYKIAMLISLYGTLNDYLESVK